MQDFLRAAESQGIPTTDDLQDLVTGQYVTTSPDGTGYWLTLLQVVLNIG
jgi:hypothetical protein